VRSKNFKRLINSGEPKPKGPPALGGPSSRAGD
jgi:hypothetical protein